MSIGTENQTNTGTYYFELSVEPGGRVYAETRLPKPGRSNPESKGSDLLGNTPEEVAENIAKRLADAGQVPSVRICTGGDNVAFEGSLLWHREQLEDQTLERIIALVAERNPGLQILR